MAQRVKKSAPVGSAKQRDAQNPVSLDQAAADINRDLGPGTMVRADQTSAIAPIPKLPTGSIAFDLALGGGIPVNKMTEIVGWESAGKTTFCFKTIAANQRCDPEFTVIWCAAEDYDGRRAEQCGVDNSRIMLLQENVMELVYDKVVDLTRQRVADMWVIDSYPQLVTHVEDEEDIQGNKVQGGAKVTNIFMRRIGKATRRSLLDAERPMTGLFVNQWRNKVGVMFGDPRTTPGGLQKNFYFWARLEVVREEMLIERDKNGNGRGALGQRIQINTFKNKQAPPRDAGSADYYFRPKYEDSRLVLPGDYDLGRELLNLGLVFDVVTKNGSMYAYGNASWRGEYAFSQAVMAEPALYAAIESDIRAEAARRELPVAEQPEPRRRRMRSVS